MEKPPSDSLSALRRLYPNLSEDELKRADESIEAYLAAMLRLFQRIDEDPVARKTLKDGLRLDRRQKKKGKKLSRQHDELT